MSNSNETTSQSKPKMVIDRNHKPIQVGQTVRVYGGKLPYKAKVIEVYPESPTVAKAGYWVKIEDYKGSFDMMSYLLEVSD